MAVSTLAVKHVLPCCGAELRHFVSCQTLAPDDQNKWVREAGDVIEYWLNERTARHQCSKVGSENPMGLVNRPQRRIHAP